MKISFCTLGCPNWSINEIAMGAKWYGYDGVELRVKGDKHVDPCLSEVERKTVKELL